MEKKVEQKNTITRAPIVVIMGHIDHGKSTLLDYIRKTNIVEKEVGGITQRLSAYQVVHNQKPITFLDTPGHAAFTAMRQRGATVADIAILVVSAEDGVKPQTKEALQTILEAKLPYIVAINKIDKPNADIDRTKQSLAENEIYVEGYGGTIPFVPISAKTGDGVNDLLDTILLLAELEGLKGTQTGNPSGVVIESHRDAKRGISAAVIVKDGVIKKGDFIISGNAGAPIRIMENFLGKMIDEASAGMPAQIVGWSDAPEVGTIFKIFPTKKEGEKALEEILEQSVNKDYKQAPALNDGQALLPLIIKADTQGSLDAIKKEIDTLQKKEPRVKLKVLLEGTGNINESDVKAGIATTLATVVGFGVKINPDSKELAERQSIPVHLFDIIYKLTEWLEEYIKSKVLKVEVEEVVGKAKVQKLFSENRDKQIIGGKVLSGTLVSGANCKIMRRDFEIARGKILGLQQQKSKTKEVAEGNEFGAEIQSKVPVAPGDILEVTQTVLK